MPSFSASERLVGVRVFAETLKKSKEKNLDEPLPDLFSALGDLSASIARMPLSRRR